MNKREARREARAILAHHARVVANDLGVESRDDERVAQALLDLAEFLEPAPVVVPVDPAQQRLVESDGAWAISDGTSA